MVGNSALHSRHRVLVRLSAFKVSKPDQQFWGWGLTANRSMDGGGTVRVAVFSKGGQVTDQSGQIVVLNTESYRRGRRPRSYPPPLRTAAQ